MITFSKKQKNIIAIFFAGIIGLIFFWILFSETLNPQYDAWLLGDEPDPTQHYLGWNMYRTSDWSFPVGVAKNYGYPAGVPITYTDSIPLLAIIFKLFRSFLPQTFQYFGIWILICCILQAIFGYLLINIITKKRIISVIGSALFLLSPIMLFRFGGHNALGGHWLILFGLYLFFRQHQKIQWKQWSTLNILSILVHPYFLFMNGFLMLADIVNLFIKNKKKFFKLILFLLLQIIIVLLIGFGLGLHLVGEAASVGYGQFSMNLNSVINPLGFSKILPDLTIMQFQKEGFNYLGLGVLLLLILSIVQLFKKGLIFKSIKKNWLIITIGFVLFFIALSNVITLNDNILFTTPLPEIITNDILGIIRASGRMFWPVFYFIVLSSFYIIKTNKRIVAFILLILAISIQGFDLSDKLKEIDIKYENKTWQNQIITDDLNEIFKDYKHISFLPVVPLDNYSSFVMYAAQNNMTTNNGLFAKSIKDIEKNISNEIKQLKTGKVDKDTIYVFSHNADDLTSNLNLEQHYLTKIDKLKILFPYYSN